MPTRSAPARETAAKPVRPGAGRREPFRRVLLKLSGEAFCTPGGFGVDPPELDVIAREVKSAVETGAQVAVVVGGGQHHPGRHARRRRPGAPRHRRPYGHARHGH